MLGPVTTGAGFTLVELMITISILGLLLAIAVPSMTTWIQNTMIRTSAEEALAGLARARNEALKRNTPVRFQLLSALDNSCEVKGSGTNWMVTAPATDGSQDVVDPSGLCKDLIDAAPPSPAMVEFKSSAAGSKHAVLAATASGVDAGVVTFNGVGRLSGAGNVDTIDITNPTGGKCAPDGDMRCLRIIVSSGGQFKMCDPKVTDVADTRRCQF